MKSFIGAINKCIIGLLLSLGLFVSSVYAQDYYNQDRNAWLIPASRGSLQPVHINWQEAQVNSKISWIRYVQANIEAYFSQNPDRRMGETNQKPADWVASGGSKQIGANGNKTITPAFQSVITATNITAASATINWSTNELVTTTIVYGTSNSVNSSGNLVGSSVIIPGTSSATSSTSAPYIYSDNLTSLLSAVGYYYQLTITDSKNKTSRSAIYTFTTGGTPVLQDAALASLVQTDKADGSLSRADMISIFGEVGLDGVVSSTEFTDLQTIIENSTSFGLTQDYVYQLSSDVVMGNAWNSTYQGSALGNLKAGSTGTQLSNLVNKWFLGSDHPVAVDDYGTTYTYKQAAGSLFVSNSIIGQSGPITYDDIKQGYVGDCWLMASFAETALRDTSIIQNMFIDNGDNTYTVRLFHNGAPTYVTVDRQLPVDSNGLFGFADVGASYTNANNELWTALAEKAVVEAQASWGIANAYKSIDGGYIGVGLGDVTGHAYTIGNSLNFNAAVASWNSGALMGFASKSSNTTLGVISGHAYPVVGYNSKTQQFTLFNPWGINNGFAPGLLTLSWSQIQSNFSYYDTAVA